MDGTNALPEVDAERLESFAGKVMGDMGGAFAVLLSYLADGTGIYRALRDTGRCDAATLASAAGVDPRYLREWLSAQAAAEYVVYHDEDDTFSLTPEQAVVLAQEGDPACLQGFIELIVSQFATHETAAEVLRSGAGRPWDTHAACCFCGTDRFFRPGYAANLIEHWLPALDGVLAKLEAGARIADVGCGLGSSALLMARAFPRSTIHGFDFHDASIEAARDSAYAAGLAANTRFETVSAKEVPAEGYDLICMFDALHDMGDPVGAARHLRKCLADDGTLMLVEPLARDRLADNLHLLGQLFYSASTLICTPASRAQEVGLALGAQAGPARLTGVLTEAGFGNVRCAAETASNMIFEARP
jgi:2-polyprenyl-3-methyl-5-hydroxy-6-metoxy-1,4-benzoquinol methylase